MHDSFKRVLRLIEKTGDRFVVAEGEELYVVMSVSQYEGLLGAGGQTGARAVPERGLTPPAVFEQESVYETPLPPEEPSESSPDLAAKKPFQPPEPEGMEETQFYLEPID